MSLKKWVRLTKIDAKNALTDYKVQYGTGSFTAETQVNNEVGAIILQAIEYGKSLRSQELRNLLEVHKHWGSREE